MGECNTIRDNLHTLMRWNVTKCMQQAYGNFGGLIGVTLRILGGMGSTGRIGCGGSLRAILPTCSKVTTCRFELDADSSPLQANTTALPIPQPQPPHTFFGTPSSPRLSQTPLTRTRSFLLLVLRCGLRLRCTTDLLRSVLSLFPCSGAENVIHQYKIRHGSAQEARSTRGRICRV